MKNNKNINYYKTIYIFFIFLSLTIFFFSTTTKLSAKAFEIENVEITKPFEIKFNKNDVVDEGFKKAFKELMMLIVKSSDQKKIGKIKLNEIKAMIESFTIKEEKFINEIYYVNLGVSFNKKKIFKYLENKNIFPSIPKKKKFLFFPIIIEENKKDLLMFGNNIIYDEWNKNSESYHLIEYILPTEDLEDLNTIKNEYENIEKYNFKEITNKYFLNNSIIFLVFKKENELRILSRITIKNNIFLENKSFQNIDLNNKDQVNRMIKELKTDFEDYWKNSNQINTSIKLPLTIKVKNTEEIKIANFENVLKEKDLIYDFFITKFDKDFTIYKIVFNGTPDIFLKSMKEKDFDFNTQNKIWILK